MTDIKLLPLTYGLDEFPSFIRAAIKAYARAVAEHNVKKRDAEIEALRAEVNRWKSNYNAAIELKGRAFAESDRLEEALRDIESRPWNGVRPIQIAARAALRDHDQEATND